MPNLSFHSCSIRAILSSYALFLSCSSCVRNRCSLMSLSTSLDLLSPVVSACMSNLFAAVEPTQRLIDFAPTFPLRLLTLGSLGVSQWYRFVPVSVVPQAYRGMSWRSIRSSRADCVTPLVFASSLSLSAASSVTLALTFR